MEKNQIRKFAEKQIAEFQNPNYNPYQFDEYTEGLLNLGFRPNTAAFIKNHPEVAGDDGIDVESGNFMRAVRAERDISALGNLILAYARNEARSAWSAADIDYKKQIEPLKALAELCK